MTQFESEEDLFDLSNNSDAGPEETVEIVDQGGPSLTGEEQTRTIERQDQRSPPPMYDMGEEPVTQQNIRQSEAMERQEQQSLPDAEAGYIIEEQAETIDIRDQRNPLPVQDIGEEPATQLIGQSETNEGQAGREPDRLQDATLRKSREEASIKQELLQTMEHLGSIARREERTPPPMQDNAGEGYEQSPSLTQDATTQDARIQISEPESTTVSAIPTQQITEQLETITPRTQPHGPNTHEEEKRGKKREREVEVDTETDPSLFPLREREQEFQRHLRVRRDERLGEETSIWIRPLRRLQPQRPQKKARLE
jgi:hypothetical protein